MFLSSSWQYKNRSINFYQFILLYWSLLQFIRPGAKRIVSASSSKALLTTAFQNQDGSIVIIVMNVGDDEISFSLSMSSKTAQLNTLPHSIQTLIIKS